MRHAEGAGAFGWALNGLESQRRQNRRFIILNDDRRICERCFGHTCRAQFFVEPGYEFPAHLLRAELLEDSRVMRIMETLVARRVLFEQIGGLDPQFATGEDVDWYARAQDAGAKLGVIDETLLRKRIHDANTSLTTPENTGYLLRALQRSIARKREQPSLTAI